MSLSRQRLLSIFFLLVALVVFILAYQSPQTVVVDLGSVQADKFLDNFNAAERGYRWSQEHSAVWLSGLGGGNLAWTVGVRLRNPWGVDGAGSDGANDGYVTLTGAQALAAMSGAVSAAV